MGLENPSVKELKCTNIGHKESYDLFINICQYHHGKLKRFSENLLTMKERCKTSLRHEIKDKKLFSFRPQVIGSKGCKVRVTNFA